MNPMMRETSVTVFILLFKYLSVDPFSRGSIRRIFRSLPSSSTLYGPGANSRFSVPPVLPVCFYSLYSIRVFSDFSTVFFIAARLYVPFSKATLITRVPAATLFLLLKSYFEESVQKSDFCTLDHDEQRQKHPFILTSNIRTIVSLFDLYIILFSICALFSQQFDLSRRMTPKEYKSPIFVHFSKKTLKVVSRR